VVKANNTLPNETKGLLQNLIAAAWLQGPPHRPAADAVDFFHGDEGARFFGVMSHVIQAI